MQFSDCQVGLLANPAIIRGPRRKIPPRIRPAICYKRFGPWTRCRKALSVEVSETLVYPSFWHDSLWAKEMFIHCNLFI